MHKCSNKNQCAICLCGYGIRSSSIPSHGLSLESSSPLLGCIANSLLSGHRCVQNPPFIYSPHRGHLVPCGGKSFPRSFHSFQKVHEGLSIRVFLQASRQVYPIPSVKYQQELSPQKPTTRIAANLYAQDQIAI